MDSNTASTHANRLNQLGKQTLELRRDWLSFSEEDEKLVLEIGDLLSANIDLLIDDMYAHFLSFPQARQFFPNEQILLRAQAAQKQYFLRLTKGNFNEDYVAERLTVGHTHYRIGLDPGWYLGAYSRVLTWLRMLVHQHYGADVDRSIRCISALTRLVFFDMSLAIEAYCIAKEMAVVQYTESQTQASEYARSLIEASLDPLVTISADGKITDVNEATIKVTGIERDKLLGTDFLDYFTEPGKAREGYQEVFAKGFVTDYPLAIRHKDGRVTNVLYNASVYKDADGNVLGVFAAARDVTAQKQASEYARSLIEASLDPLVTISADGKITDVNEATIKVTGIAREKLLGTDFLDYFTEPGKAREGYQEVFAKGFVTDYPLAIRHKGGRVTNVLYNASVYKDASGNVLGVFAAARDVTAQKQAAEYSRSLLAQKQDEAQVAEQRVKELERLADLERFQKLTVGRELKMIELKKEIEELKRLQAPQAEDGI